MKNSVFGHKKLRQISPVKNQPQRPGLHFPEIHLGPSCKIPEISYFFFFWPLKRELFLTVSFDRVVSKLKKKATLTVCGKRFFRHDAKWPRNLSANNSNQNMIGQNKRHLSNSHARLDSLFMYTCTYFFQTHNVKAVLFLKFSFIIWISFFSIELYY